MRIATWNVNSMGARLPRVLQFLAEHVPDVLCVQETKCTPERFPRAEVAEAGYAVADHSAGRWAGVALLARHGLALSDVRCGLPGETRPEEARWVEADVGGTRVASVYVPNGRAVGTAQFADKLAFLEAVGLRVADGDAPRIVVGDFNVAPADADVYDPAVFAGGTHVTPEERSRLKALLSCDLVDAYRHLHPDEVGFTWWDYRAGHFHKGLGLRIDLALVHVGMVDRLRRCGIDRTYRKGSKPSDHAPLLMDLA